MVEQNSHNSGTEYTYMREFRLPKQSDKKIGTEIASTLSIVQLCNHSSPKTSIQGRSLHINYTVSRTKLNLSC